MDERDIVFSPERIGNASDIADEIRKAVGGRDFRITKHFIDARHRKDIKIVYRVSLDRSSSFDNSSLALPFKRERFKSPERPVIVGFGPAGMFAGLVLARYGLNPVILEKGRCVSQRSLDVEKYKETAKIDPSSNIQFGEGGAGTFSDGKLYTGVSSGLKAFIGDTFIRYGAPEDIRYDSHPHVGTDNLVNVVSGIRSEIVRLGGEILFSQDVKDLSLDSSGRIRSVITQDNEIEASGVILAIGNSSRDLFTRLASFPGFAIESKPFAVGVRIEHLRADIDKALYGFDTALYRNICAANYKLAVDTSSGKKLYTFCMCPGGEVVPSASTTGAICTNGMSYRARDGINSNSALLVPFDPKSVSSDVLAGMHFQERLEQDAYRLGGLCGKAPSTTYGDLVKRITGTPFGKISPTYRPGTLSADLFDLFPEEVIKTISEGIGLMGRKIRGFDSSEAVLTAPETRSSSPVRLIRDRETFQSISHPGIYPAGEGAGYAGGIMSSAIDGINCANALAASLIC